MWLPHDRAVVDVWASEQARKCPDCGTFEWEWEESPEAWQAGLHWCLGCKAREELRDETLKTAHDPRGYKIRLYQGGADDG